jgi:hypothetical protein
MHPGEHQRIPFMATTLKRAHGRSRPQVAAPIAERTSPPADFLAGIIPAPRSSTASRPATWSGPRCRRASGRASTLAASRYVLPGPSGSASPTASTGSTAILSTAQTATAFGRPRFLRPLKRGGIRAEAFGDAPRWWLQPATTAAPRPNVRVFEPSLPRSRPAAKRRSRRPQASSCLAGIDELGACGLRRRR